MKYKLLILLFIACTPFLKAQVSIDAEIRPRSEFNDGVKSLLDKGQSPALVTSQRSRLNLSYLDDRVST